MAGIERNLVADVLLFLALLFIALLFMQCLEISLFLFSPPSVALPPPILLSSPRLDNGET